MILNPTNEWSSHFLDLKRELVQAITQERITQSWHDLLGELAKHTTKIAQEGTNVNFAGLDKLTLEEINMIKSKGCVVIRGVVDTEMASGWKTELEEFLKANPHTPGFPEEGNKQIFHLYWTRPQIQARAHPNVLRASAWLRNLYHVRSGKTLDGVDLSVPLTYADRFRIREPNNRPGILRPHIDGVVRLSDGKIRFSVAALSISSLATGVIMILMNSNGALRYIAHVRAEDIPGVDIYETGPTQGALQVFPNVLLSSVYIILRPFFRPTVPHDSPTILDPKNWKFDISTPDFPGIYTIGGQYYGPFLSPKDYPHLELEQTMTSVPKVNPGDMVFWHCCANYGFEPKLTVYEDVVHAVENQHTGATDPAVIYIAAVPKTPQNVEYIVKQLPTFLVGETPPDYVIPGSDAETTPYVGLATDADIKDANSRLAMGLPAQIA